MVTVYAWYPWEWYHYMFGMVRTERGVKSAGHTTLLYSRGYVSLWVGSRISESYADDLASYGVLPHRQVTLVGLDELAIHHWWQAFKAKVRSGTLQYSFSGLNCAKTVALALEAGSGGKSKSWHSWNLVWSPKDAIQYAEALRSGSR